LEDLRIALITCTIQVYNQDSNMKPWSERQLIGLANNYLMQAIALRDDLQAQKFENYPPSLVNTIDTSVATRQPDDSSDRADDQQNFVQGDLSLSPSVATAKAGSREDGALSAEAPQTFAGYPSWEPQPPAAALAPSSSPSRRWPRWMSSKSPSPSPTERSTKGDSPSNYPNNERTTLTQVSVTKDGAAKNGVEPSTALPASDVNAVLRSGSSGALTDRSPEKRRSINRSITEEGGAKATALRIRIAATEYEISRGETIINAEDKRARRKSTQRNSELEEIRDSLVSQKNDLEHMKKEYLALSGIPYENFSRLNDHSQAGSKTKSYPHSMPRFWTTKATAQCCKTSGKIRVMLIVLLFTALFAMCTLHAPTSMT
jgi:hypothetical protein